MAGFYLGERHMDLGDVEVFSWAAPIACAFFRGTIHHDLCADVAVVRSFEHRAGVISAVADEALIQPAPENPFPLRQMHIPVPPGPAVTAPAPRVPPDPPTSRPRRPPPPKTMLPSQTKGGLRAAHLLLARISAPRTRDLQPVLSTLQPDQYDLVTQPATTSRIIEGHPGTGKSIVAAHRAAFLVSGDASDGRGSTGKVLLVGPNNEYVRHVRTILDRLVDHDAELEVVSLPALIDMIIRQTLPKRSAAPRGRLTKSWRDVDVYLGNLPARQERSCSVSRERNLLWP